MNVNRPSLNGGIPAVALLILIAAAARSPDTKAWKQAPRYDSESDYARCLQQFPQGRHGAEAAAKIEVPSKQNERV